MELLDKIMPILEWIRSFLMTISTFISGVVSFPVENVYLIIIIIISIFLARRILKFFYSDFTGRNLYWLILAGIIFWVIKYL